MFTKVKFYMLVLTDKEDGDEYLRIAAKYNLVGLNKIGCYGNHTQTELFLKGRWLNMKKFMKEVNSIRSINK